jgi:aspartate/glutamate racemase
MLTNKKEMTFGIISGAGPMAGISLMTQIIKYCQSNGAWRDRDFPEIRLINIPFSEMLEPGYDSETVRSELDKALRELESNSRYFVIACNTLHLFLPPRPINGLINLVDLMKAKISSGSRPLVLASKTSAENNLHGKLLNIPCEYWNPEESQRLIDTILAGRPIDLNFLFELGKKRTVILGCTEYSLVVQDLKLPPTIIDPLRLASEFIGQKAVEKIIFHSSLMTDVAIKNDLEIIDNHNKTFFRARL